MLIKSIRTAFIYISILLLTVTTVFAQDDDAEAIFRRGSVLFKQGKYVSASLDFKNVVNNYSSNPWAIPAYMMLAKTFFNLEEFEMAESTAIKLRTQYPKSSFVEWTYYLTAACKFRLKELDEAASILSRLASTTNDESLRLKSLSAISNSILPTIDKDVIYKILDENGIKLSELENLKQFDIISEQNNIDNIITDSGTVQIMKKWEAGLTFKIGLLSPLTGIDSDLGIQLLKGVQAILGENKYAEGKRIELIVEDIESDPVTAVLKTRKLIEQGVIAIIGPVLSNTTIPAAVESQAHGIPFIAPTATDIRLTSIGRYIFQLNLNPVVQAEALADFAVNTLHFSNFAVIAVNDWWGAAVGDRFSREMEKNGAVKILTGYLDQNMSLSDNILMNIRENAPLSEATINNIIIVNNGTAFPDTLFFKQDIIYHGERRLGPINTIDCILVSATSEEAIRIASLIMEYNINTVILGDSGWWSNEKTLESGGKYIEGAFIVAPAGELSGGSGLSFFTNVPGSLLKPDIPFMKGADACNILIHCLQNGARDPDTLVEMLESIRDYKGISSQISIDPENHTNRAVEFIWINNGSYFTVNDEIVDIYHKQQEKFTEVYDEPTDLSVPSSQ